MHKKYLLRFCENIFTPCYRVLHSTIEITNGHSVLSFSCFLYAHKLNISMIFRYYHFHKNLLETNMHMLLNLIKLFAIHTNLFIEKYNEHIVHLKIQSIRVSFFCFIWDTAQVSKKNQYPLLMFLKYIFQRFFAPKLALGICRSIMQKTCFL